MKDEPLDRLRATLGLLYDRSTDIYARARARLAELLLAIHRKFPEGDGGLLLELTVGIYLAYVIVSLVLGLNVNGTVNTLQRITFLSAVYALVVLALNLHWGYAGLFNIGVAGFMAVGVYTMGMMTGSPTGSPPGLGLPLPIGILGGVLAASLVGAITALPAIRLRADYLAIVTLALSEILRLSFLSSTLQEFTLGGWEFDVPYLSSWIGDLAVPGLALGTGAGRGMSLPRNPVRAIYYHSPGEPTPVGDVAFEVLSVLQPTVIINWTYAVFLVLVVAGFYWLLSRIGNSPFGRVLKAIREDELVAKSLGKDTNRFKIKTLALGCGVMGLAGILWQGSQGYVDPSRFVPLVTFYVFIALIIGGPGSNTGSIVGGAVFASLLFEGPNFVRRIVREAVALGDSPNTFVGAIAPFASLDIAPFFAFLLANLANLRPVLLGIVLIYLVQRRPEGLLGHRKETAAAVDLTERTPGGGADE